MKIGKSQIEHQSDVVAKMSDALAKRFFKYDSKNPDESIDSTLISLSKSIGYLTVVNNAVVNTFKHEKRLKVLEDKLKNSSINMQMFEEAPLKEYR